MNAGSTALEEARHRIALVVRIEGLHELDGGACDLEEDDVDGPVGERLTRAHHGAEQGFEPCHHRLRVRDRERDVGESAGMHHHVLLRESWPAGTRRTPRAGDPRSRPAWPAP